MLSYVRRVYRENCTNNVENKADYHGNEQLRLYDIGDIHFYSTTNYTRILYDTHWCDCKIIYPFETTKLSARSFGIR